MTERTARNDMTFAAEAEDTAYRRRLEEDRLAADIIDECRTQLMMRFRFLDLALWRMGLEPSRVGARYPLMTDGGSIYFDPPREIARFQGSYEETVRDFLHLIMHCVFRHPYDRDRADEEAWSLTCDIIVENVVMELCGARFASPDDLARREALDQIRMLAGSLLPGRVHDLVHGLVMTPSGQHFRGIGRSVLNEWHVLFERDDHGAWPANDRDANSEEGPEGTERQEMAEDDEDPDAQAEGLRAEAAGESERQDARGEIDPDEGEQQDDIASSELADDEREGSEENERGEEPGEASLASDEGGVDDRVRPDSSEEERQRKEWEEIAKEMAMDLETFAKGQRDDAGSLMANLALTMRKTSDYSDFLRRFMVRSEEVRVNMEEFDYLPYVFGLDTYGNMPLIEPLEYQETERVRDLVIVVDTSESVRGEQVCRFLQRTFDIVSSSQAFGHSVRIHLIQSDSRVQSDLLIEDRRDIEAAMESFTVRGFGGTDFRPAFDHVAMLRARGELEHLRGLIYFTDGLGQFPEKPPDYDAAFVFVEEEGRETPPVPPWAMKVVLNERSLESPR